MATIQIADDDARVQYTQAVVANTTQLTIDFPFFDLDDLNVIVTDAAGTDTVLTRGTGTGTFAVVGVSVDDGFSGGYVTLGDSYSAGTDTFTLFRDIAVERTTDFPTSGPFNISSLNTELDKIIAIEQELETKITRTLQLADSDGTVDLKLPNLNTRKGTTLAFNATTGEPEAGPTVAGVTTVGALAADIATLADIEDGTVATDAISDTAAIAANVTTVAGISSNVTTVSGNTSNINTVAGNTTNINTVAGNNANVTTVAGISGNVTTVAGISADVTAVAGDATDIGTVSANISNVNSVAAIDTDVTTVAGMSGADITTVAGISSDVTTAAGVSANITTVAGIAADVTAAATNASDISAIAAEVSKVVTVANDLNEAVSEIDVVANNISDINTCGTNIAAIQNAPTQAAAAAASASSAASSLTTLQSTFQSSASAPSSPTEGDLWYDTVNSALKVYVSGSWQTAGAYLQGLTSTHVFTATAAQTTFTTDDASNTMSIFANGNTLVFLNGIRLVEGSSGVNDYYINGSSVELNSGTAAGDVLYVEIFTKVSTTQEASLNQLVTDAQTAEANALTSETNAAASAASASANATSTAADVVTTNADVVSTNADVVSSAASASAASTSASNAATSETNAAASASQAASSAGGGTLKITSNDTTSDVLGNKLVAGTGITATTNNAGGNETLTLSVNPFSLTESNATATAAQTSFNVSYTVGLIQVFMNGVKLISGSDFTASNGTSVTLASGAAAGDVLEFVVFG